jgi:hypothetical protein
MVIDVETSDLTEILLLAKPELTPEFNTLQHDVELI